MSIDFVDIADLCRILDEKFEVKLNICNKNGNQYFSIENNNPAATDYISYYFYKKNYSVKYNDELTEFYIEETRTC